VKAYRDVKSKSLLMHSHEARAKTRRLRSAE